MHRPNHRRSCSRRDHSRPRVTRALASLAFATTSVAFITSLVPGAAYGDEPGILDPQAVIGSITPELLTQGTEQSRVEVSDGPAARGGDAASAPVVEISDLQYQDQFLANGVSYTVDYATSVAEPMGQFEVLETTSTNVAAYIQPTPSGVRTLTAIASADAPVSYSYTFDVPDGTTLEFSNNVYRLRGQDGSVYGALQEPWATDSEGNSLETSYSWEGSTLTQHVELDDAEAFPVLLDPNWGYSQQWNLGSTSNWTTVDIQQNFYDCLNCYFALPGAPKAWPSYGKILPLYMSLGASGYIPFEVMMAGDFYDVAHWWGWQFYATENHIDGEGSIISFTYQYGQYGNDYSSIWQSVDTFIVNDFPLHLGGNAAYQAGAWFQWNDMANRVKADRP
ncbi:hypothetical protein DY023_04570 [Microbacterium bovistercoris]|uniref:Uncharacterized protein n=1 Tax=Microbacterium bovistercoris TaxID=2293570 RepID=A0A371NVY8_9MICO|nr:hypothetical protein [Microbacterium bovistercoris]REJ06981.1 hypothetical protein DY023_04570 [Microbacterium bovistercoris]